MSIREKIIVSVMAAAVLLGGYLYVGPVTTGSRPGVEKQSDGPAFDFAQKVIQQLKEDTSLTRDLFTIRSAERKWEKDPFLKNDTLLSDSPKHENPDNATVSTDTESDWVYTGFIEVGAQRLAIINGMEYTSGDAIDGQGYYVRRIHPGQVEIGKPNTPGVIILKLTENEAISGK
ncbi:hypothetical protein [uncultured Desulfosarcina sp.]|uniref:hypothetical protein n=1 Tax=uncultured Desulfosarcina sp. TaxID=218289 RepID=UPI0029C69AFE|nr:hypothetical protein [uncultured Desulfosarcina sp.]